MGVLSDKWVRLENTERNHYKFYEIHQCGDTVVSLYGRIGNKPQHCVKRLKDPTAALRHFLSLQEQKLKKGYVDVSDSPQYDRGSVYDDDLESIIEAKLGPKKDPADEVRDREVYEVIRDILGDDNVSVKDVDDLLEELKLLGIEAEYGDVYESLRVLAASDKKAEKIRKKVEKEAESCSPA